MSDRHYYGYVRAARNSFKVVDGVTTFNPINSHQGAVHPTSEPVADEKGRWGDKKYGVEFIITGNEHFLVMEDTNKSDGCGPRVEAGRYFDYADAYRAAQGKGVQGGLGVIQIVVESGVSDYIVIGPDGEKVVLETSIYWSTQDLSKRLRLLDGREIE